MLGSLPYDENIPETKFENKNRTELDENDYFLKGFLIGYRREKDRIKEWRAMNEEKKKREFDISIGEIELRGKEWRSVISEIIKKEVTSQFNEMKQTICYLNEDRMRRPS